MLMDPRVQRELMRMLGNADQPCLINPPAHRMIARLSLLWLFMFGALLIAYNILIVISVIMFLIFAFYYYVFAVRWRGYGYSGKLLHSSTAIVWIASAIIASPIRTWMFALINNV